MEIELRVVLLAVGLLILLVVSLDFLRRRQLQASQPAAQEPRANNVAASRHKRRFIDDYAETDLDLMTPQLAADSAASLMPNQSYMAEQYAATDTVADPVIDEKDEFEPQHLIVISIMARDSYGFEGANLLSACNGAQLEYSNGMFQRYEDSEIIFSVVNAMEPGHFILETLEQEHVPGISLIMLPEHLANPASAFDKMIRLAKQMAFALNGELLDHERQPLTLDTIEQYRKETQAITKRS